MNDSLNNESIIKELDEENKLLMKKLGQLQSESLDQNNNILKDIDNENYNLYTDKKEYKSNSNPNIANKNYDQSVLINIYNKENNNDNYNNEDDIYEDENIVRKYVSDRKKHLQSIKNSANKTNNNEKYKDIIKNLDINNSSNKKNDYNQLKYKNDIPLCNNNIIKILENNKSNNIYNINNTSDKEINLTNNNIKNNINNNINNYIKSDKDNNKPEINQNINKNILPNNDNRHAIDISYNNLEDIKTNNYNPNQINGNNNVNNQNNDAKFPIDNIINNNSYINNHYTNQIHIKSSDIEKDINEIFSKNNETTNNSIKNNYDISYNENTKSSLQNMNVLNKIKNTEEPQETDNNNQVKDDDKFVCDLDIFKKLQDQMNKKSALLQKTIEKYSYKQKEPIIINDKYINIINEESKVRNNPNGIENNVNKYNSNDSNSNISYLNKDNKIPLHLNNVNKEEIENRIKIIKDISSNKGEMKEYLNGQYYSNNKYNNKNGENVNDNKYNEDENFYNNLDNKDDDDSKSDIYLSSRKDKQNDNEFSLKINEYNDNDNEYNNDNILNSDINLKESIKLFTKNNKDFDKNIENSNNNINNNNNSYDYKLDYEPLIFKLPSILLDNKTTEIEIYIRLELIYSKLNTITQKLSFISLLRQVLNNLLMLSNSSLSIYTQLLNFLLTLQVNELQKSNLDNSLPNSYLQKLFEFLLNQKEISEILIALLLLLKKYFPLNMNLTLDLKNLIYLKLIKFYFDKMLGIFKNYCSLSGENIIKSLLLEVNDFLYLNKPSLLNNKILLGEFFMEIFVSVRGLVDIIIGKYGHIDKGKNVVDAIAYIKSREINISKDFLKYLEYKMFKISK